MIDAMTNYNPQPWVDTEGVADRYRVSKETVRTWRKQGTGPTGVRLGRRVLYSIVELERWEREQAAKQVRAAS